MLTWMFLALVAAGGAVAYKKGLIRLDQIGLKKKNEPAEVKSPQQMFSENILSFREKIGRHKSVVQELATRRDTCQGKLAYARERFNEISTKISELVAASAAAEEIEALRPDFNTKMKKVEGLEDEFARLDSEYTSAASALTTLEEEAKQLQTAWDESQRKQGTLAIQVEASEVKSGLGSNEDLHGARKLLEEMNEKNNALSIKARLNTELADTPDPTRDSFDQFLQEKGNDAFDALLKSAKTPSQNESQRGTQLGE